MLHMTMILEDHAVTALYRMPETGKPMWHVTVCDVLTGEQTDFRFTEAQWLAIVALAVGGDDIPGAMDFYQVLEGIGWGKDNKFRLIP